MITVTTVGYGDVVPVTPVGKFMGALLGFIGVVMVALPAGIMASGFSHSVHRRQARFSRSVDQFLDDGVIDINDLRLLKAQGVSMNLSEETMDNLIQDKVAGYPESADYCPHCHKKLS